MVDIGGNITEQSERKKFASGMVYGGVQSSIVTHVNEMLPSRLRRWVPTFNILCHALAILVVTLVSYIWRDIDKIYELLFLNPAVCILPSLLFPESIRWLIVKKRYQDAETVIKQIRKINGDDNLEDFSVYFRKKDSSETKSIESDHPNSASQLLWKLLQARSLLRSGFIMGLISCSGNLCYYGVVYGAENFPGSIHLNVVLLISPNTLSMIMNSCGTRYLGRRSLTVMSGIITGSLCLLVGFIIDGNRWLAIGVGITCLLFVEVFCAMGFQYPPEVYPTEIRGSGTGFTLALGRVGTILAPEIKSLFRSSPISLYAAFGLPIIMSAILCIILPETSNKELPKTFEEADQRCQFQNHDLYQRLKTCLSDEYRRVYYEPTTLTPYEKLE